MALIIWLDDNPVEVQTSIQKVSDAGYQVKVVYNERECVSVLESGHLPNLIIQDLHREPSIVQVSDGAPRKLAQSAWVSGWSFYEDVLRPHFPQIPVIICTYDTYVVDNRRRADDYNLMIVDKYDTDALLSAVNNLQSAQQALHASPAISPNIIAVDFSKVNEALIRHLALNPVDLHSVSWATFEGLVERLLKEMDYEVFHTPLTRDGGVDIWAIKRTDLGEILYAIDAKKYSPNKILGPEPVRAIHGVADMNKASVGMIVTTARFGPAAISLANQYRYRLSLKDYHSVVDWLKYVSGKHTT